MMIILDIDFTTLPKDQLRKAEANGHIYGKVVVSRMKQPDKYGNEYTVYMQREKGADRIYIGKGKEYGTRSEQAAVNDFPSDLGF